MPPTAAHWFFPSSEGCNFGPPNVQLSNMGRMMPLRLALCCCVSMAASQVVAQDRGELIPGHALAMPAARTLQESDDHINLDNQDLNQVELSEQDWLLVDNPYARIYGQSNWPSELPVNGPSEMDFMESFFGIWQSEIAGFSPFPMTSISQYRRDLHLRQDMRAALRLRVLERNPDGSVSDRLLQDQLQIAGIFVKFSTTPATGTHGRPVVEGMYHLDYFEDYDCPCEFGSGPFEVLAAAKVFDPPPTSKITFSVPFSTTVTG